MPHSARLLRTAASIPALALAFVLASPVAGYAACVYPRDYVVRRNDMTVDYAATMECVKTFEEETEKLVEESTEQLDLDLEAYDGARPNSARRRSSRVRYNIARSRLRETEQQIAEIRATMDNVYDRTRGYRMLAQIPPPPEDRKFRFIRPPGAVSPVPDPE